MDLALTIHGWIDEEIIFAQQLGSRHVFARVDGSQDNLSGGDARPLAWMANRIEKAGLVLAGLHITGGKAGAARHEATLAWAARLAREAGAARIGLLSLSPALFPANSVQALLPPLADAAAQAGVKLAVPAQLLLKERSGSLVDLESTLLNLNASVGLEAAPGLLLDWLQKTDPGVHPRSLLLDRLSLVSIDHERRPGSRLKKQENGVEFEDLLSVCWRLRQAGYPGLIRLGQPSPWKGDTGEGYHARAFATGYLRAALQAFQRTETLR